MYRRRFKRMIANSLPFQLFRRLIGKRLFVLTFHRIRSSRERLPTYDSCPSLGVDYFERLIIFLKNEFEVVPLTKIAERISGADRSHANSCAITFDDGWRDNYDVAFPILSGHEIPATIFVTTGKIGESQPFWQQKLGRVYQELAKRLGNGSTGGEAGSWTAAQFRQTVARLKSLNPEDRQLELQDLFALVDQSRFTERMFLDSREIIEMSQNGINFGSHTVSHALLSQLNAEEIRAELRKSKTCLEALLDQPIISLAYPDGNYNLEVMEIARDLGYTIGCTTEPGVINATCRPLSIPRIEIEWDTGGERSIKFNEGDVWWCLR